MTTNQNSVAPDSHPCPTWCTTSAMHQREFEFNRSSSFTHEGSPQRVATLVENHQRKFDEAEIYFTQTVLVHDGVSEPGPIGVAIRFAENGFTRDDARELAKTLSTLADAIDAL